MDMDSTPAIAETAPPSNTTRLPTPAAASPATTANVETRPSWAPKTTSRMEASRSRRPDSVASSDMWLRPSTRRVAASVVAGRVDATGETGVTVTSGVPGQPGVATVAGSPAANGAGEWVAGNGASAL